MTKITKSFTRTFLLVVLFMVTGLSWGQSIWTNNIDGTNPSDSNPFTTGDVKNENITVSGIGMTGLQSNAGNNAYNVKNFSTSSTINTGSYFSFTLTPNQAYTINLTSFVFSRQRSGTGPLTWAVRSSADNYAANIGATFSPGTSSATETITLTGASFQNITSAITFRIYGWSADGANGTGRISDFTFNGTVTGGIVVTAPVATDATSITAAGFTANWNAVTGATGYRLDVSANADFTSVLEDYDGIAVTGLSQVVTSGVMPGATHYYRVRAEFGEQTSANSNTITVNVPCGVITQPIASAQSFCISGTVSQLTATGTGLKWYAASTGGDALTGTTALTAGNYYVSQTIGNCESTRTEVAVTINTTTAPTAAPIAICQAGTVVDLTATGENLKWYAAATGGDVLASTTALTAGNYYVSQTIGNCESTRTEVAVTINATTSPTAAPIAICQAGTVADLTATGENLKWYAAATGGDVLASTTALTAGNYYVSQTLNNCESTRTEVAVTINATTAPTAAPIAICQAGTVADLTATGENLKWYAAATGGDVLASTTALTAGNYFVSQTLNNCESTRTEVAVTINTTTAPTAAPIAICQAGTVADLTATGENLKWYAAATGGDVLASTIALTAGNYYVSQTLNNCESARTEVAVTINTTTAPTAAPIAICQAGTVADLTATGENLKWYAAATGGDVLASTTALTAGNYYVSQTIGNCESTRTEVAVTINTTTAPTAASIAICQAGTVADLTATGENLKWYAAATGGDVLASTTALTAGNYFVSQTLNNCESARTEVAVTINTTTAPTAAPIAICQAGTVADLTATGENLKWYAAATGGDVLASTIELTAGNYYVSQTLNNCESARTEVTVTIATPQAPDAAAMQDFTVGQTLADLDPFGDNIRWYAEEGLTTELTLTTVLADGTIYYAVQFTGNCESDALPVTANEVLRNQAFNIKGLKLYPNPVKDVLNISYTDNITFVTLYNSLGQKVTSKNVNAITTQLDMSLLPTGMYTVIVTSDNKSASIKIIR